MSWVSFWSDLLPLLASPLGAVVFVPLYALWVTLLLPGVWASMLAGALYGTWWGSLVVFVGACLGAEIVFLLGRGRLQGWARRRLAAAPKLLAVEQAVSREGLRLVLLTRLSPAFPFSLLNLAYGLSEVSLRDYTIGLIGILPGHGAVLRPRGPGGRCDALQHGARRSGRSFHLGGADPRDRGHRGRHPAGDPGGTASPGGTRPG